MANIKVKVDNAGMRDLLESAAIESELVGRMSAVQTALPGSEMTVVRRGRRVQVRVVRGSDYEEANTGELSRALDLAGGQRGYKWKSTPKQTHS
jgi:hypothetical protein